MTDPCTGEKDPGTVVTDPGTGEKDPGTVVTDPCTGEKDPGTVVTDPCTGEKDPGTVVTDPCTGEKDPGTVVTDPGTVVTDPCTGEKDPGTGVKDPGKGEKDPGTGVKDPGKGEKDPGTGEKDPGTGEKDPGTVVKDPGKGEKDPGKGVKDPGKGEKDPGKGEKDPGKGEKDPGKGVKDPGKGVKDPGKGVKDPGKGVKDPGKGETDPGKGVKDPGKGVKDPGKGVKDPGKGVKDPGKGGRDPLRSGSCMHILLRLGVAASFSGMVLSGCSRSCRHDDRASSGDPSGAAVSTGAPSRGLAEPVHVTLPEIKWSAHKQALHVLNRLAFGPRPGDVEKVAAEGVARWIGAQLRPAGIADAAVEAKLRKLPALSMSIAELHDTYPQPKPKAVPAPSGSASAGPAASAAPSMEPGMAPPAEKQTPADMLRQVYEQKILRASESERQLLEVLVDFWFNHFNVTADKDQVRWYLVSYEREAIRPHVFGKFRDLLGATAHHPAMLFYLDNFRSVAEAPDAGAGDDKKPPRGLNENYGRELLELHTLGVDGGYTQDDVRETARAFTGWGLEQPGKATVFKFHPKLHDGAPKHILGKTIADGGEKDGEHVLDLLAAHPATARFIATKLCQKFHSDHPPAALVQRVADVFKKTGGDLTAVYEALFTAPELWQDQAFRSKTKTPFEMVVSSIRAVGGTTEDADPAWREIDKLGEPLYRCAPPTGYKETADAWVSTGGLLGRLNFGLKLGAGKVRGTTFDRDKLVGTPFPDDDEALVERLAESVLHSSASSATRAVIVKEISQQKGHVVYGEPSPTVVPLALGLLLGSPEMQKQ